MSVDMTAANPADLASAYAHVADEVRRHDRDRWLAGLWAPDRRRPHLYALYAFSAEVARIRDLVSDPLPGEVRARWWAEVIDGTRRAEGEGHPVARALLDTVARFDLPVAALEKLVDARIFDLYDDPMPTATDLDAYLDDTVSGLLRLGCRLLSDRCDAEAAGVAGLAGRAYGLTGLLRAVPFHAARGQIFLPADLLDAHGVDRADILAGRTTPALKAALAELRARARSALRQTRRRIVVLPPAAAPAFLPVSLVEPWLDRMDRDDYDPFRTPVELSALRRQWRLWRAARRARRAARLYGEHEHEHDHAADPAAAAKSDGA